MTDHQTIAVYDTHVDEYEDMARSESRNPVLLEFIDRIVPNGYVLDLGCGPALASATMRDNGLRVDPVDASYEMVRVSNERFDIDARQASFDDIEGTEIYDGIWANFSLLHAAEDEFATILLQLRAALKPAGVLHLGLKTGSGTSRDKLGRYYTYYSEPRLMDHLRQAGFELIDKRTGEGRGLAGDISPWITVSCQIS